jgi:hypothetical protein
MCWMPWPTSRQNTADDGACVSHGAIVRPLFETNEALVFDAVFIDAGINWRSARALTWDLFNPDEHDLVEQDIVGG